MKVLSCRESRSLGLAYSPCFRIKHFQSSFFFSACGVVVEEMGLLVGNRSSLAPRLNERCCL